MELGVDHPAVAFSADHAAVLFHQRHDIDFPHGRGLVMPPVGCRYVGQGPGGGQVGGRVAFLTRKDVVGHSDQGVFLAEHLAVLVDKGQTVHVRIDDDAHVGPCVGYRAADLSQVFFQRFGVVGEMSVGRAVEFRNVGNPQGPQQFGDGDPAGRVDRASTTTLNPASAIAGGLRPGGPVLSRCAGRCLPGRT